MGKVIECGEMKIDRNYRLHVTKPCKINGVLEGDRVKVTLEKID